VASNEWGKLEAQFVTSLREVKTEPVPDQIVRLAQASLNGRPTGEQDKDGSPVLMHAMSITFETPERAEAFARHMRNAGPHTIPQSSVTVVVDPERGKVQDKDENGNPRVNDKGKPVMVPGDPVNPCKVAFRAGARRGRGVA
jgi:hypothetical protein